MGNGISSRMGIGSRVPSRVPIVDRGENCRTIISNADMILMLNELTSRDVKITNNNHGEKEFTIDWDIFEQKVNDLKMGLSEKKKKNIKLQMNDIKDCLKSVIKNFTVDDPGSSGSSDMINFTIEIREYSTGGRRSKTRRTKKGKRKGTRRRQRGHRRS